MDTARRGHILLVEDNAIIGMAERATLERHGYDVTLAHSGEKAIGAAADPGVDLVLMDIDLGPGMDGTEAARAILEARELPVVFLSSHTEHDIVDRTEKITSYGYIVKSSGETVLIASIRMAYRLFEARTKEREALKQLSHSHDMMRYIIAHSRSAIAVHDRDLRYLYVSDEYLRTFDIQRENVIGMNHYDVFPDLPQKWRDAHRRSLQGAVLSAEDDPYPRGDGNTLWTRWECRPWYENDGSIGGIIINTEVVNRTRRLEQALEENEHFMRTMLETTFDGFCIVDGRGRILDMNDAFCALTGYPRDELLTMLLSDVDAIDDEELMRRRIRRNVEQGAERFDTKLKHRDGTIFDARVAVATLKKDPVTFVCFFRDA
ncbi:MAG: PAS domain S-box protein [Spirochaetota bacterium]